MKRFASFIIAMILCFGFSFSSAERKTVEKDQYYLGAMRVVRCREYVTLREAPYKTAKELAKVPLGAIVLFASKNEKKYAYSPYKKQAHMFIKCEYEGQEGYILKQFLEKAPEYEPVESKVENRKMTQEELIGNGEKVLEWEEFNISVLGAHELSNDPQQPWEMIRVGCFIDDGDGPEPVWGYIESVQQTGQNNNLKAFMGGTEDDPYVFVYDAEYGLTMLDLMDGMEVWTLPKTVCPLGDASVYAIGENTGILYVTGSDGPDPVAISSEGNVLWRSEIDDPEVYGPKEIKLEQYQIEILYESGKTVKLEYNGQLIGIEDTL